MLHCTILWGSMSIPPSDPEFPPCVHCSTLSKYANVDPMAGAYGGRKMPNIPMIDYLVLAWFVSSWVGYTYFAKRKSGETASLVVAMRIYRHEWFKRMLGNENRIGDVAAVSSLVNGATFFASTSLLMLGGLGAMLGTTNRVIDVVADLPFARHDSELVWLLKIFLLISVFVYAFFKFTWSIRQYNFCAILIGAAPRTDRPDEHEDFITALTSLASFAAENSNQGLRAFYFALAALTWFVHPWLFVTATAFVVYVLYQREFHSAALYALTRPSTINQSLHLPKEVLETLRLQTASP
jgi:uncharacterized membrane protein